MEKQLVQFIIPGVTTEQYDKVWEEIRDAGHENPKGLLHHVSSLQGDNMLVMDVWESPEAFATFGETLIPIMSRMGFPDVQPIITPVYYEYTGLQPGKAN
jgi:hypothetical protein